MPLQRNDFVSQSLTNIYTSPSQMTDLRTGQPYPWGGSYVGIYFDLTEAEAQQYSTSLHEGRYRFVQIDSGATAANIVQGSVGLLAAVSKGVNVVTSFDKGVAVGLRPVVFLNAPTAAQVLAGAYVFVQELGRASVLIKSGTNGSPGDVLVAASGDAGLVTAPTQSTAITYALARTLIGKAWTSPLSGQLCTVELITPVEQG
jgi:hypothetical protein